MFLDEFDHIIKEFLSTPSARRATVLVWSRNSSEGFLSTPSARRATHRAAHPGLSREISIHALREEGDCFRDALSEKSDISIHALREEGDCSGLLSPWSSSISIHALREEGDV